MEAHYCRLIYKNPTSVPIYNHYPTLLFANVDGCERQILRLVSKTLFSKEPLDIYFYFTQKPRVGSQSPWDPPLARASLLEDLK